MNEQAFQDAYNLFVGAGYKKSIDEFRNLIATNPQALQDSYNLFVGAGYSKDMPSYKALLGLSLGSQQTTAPSINPSAGAQPQQEMAPQPQQQVQPQQQAQQTQQPQPQQQFNKLSYQAVPEQPARSVERQLMSGLEGAIPGFEKSMQQKERVIEEGRTKKKEASDLDLSLQQEAVASTARQQQEASSLAPQQYEAAAEKFPILRNELLKDVYQQLQKEENLPDFVKNQLESITPDFIKLGEAGQKNKEQAVKAFSGEASPIMGAINSMVSGLSVEEAVVPKMNYMFGPLGFTFEESGMTGDYMIVTAPNKDKIEISLNNFTQSSNQEEAKKLKNFIATKSTKITNI